MEFSKLRQSIGINTGGLSPPELIKSQGKFGIGDATKMTRPTKPPNTQEMIRCTNYSK